VSAPRTSRRTVIRQMLFGSGILAGTALLAACGAAATPPAPTTGATTAAPPAGVATPATGASGAATAVGSSPVKAAAVPTKKLAFGVGPLLATPDDTKKAYDPFFQFLAKELGAPGYDLQATTDWAGISVAMGAGQVDVAWMGPWGYVLAHNATDCFPVATVKYDDKPIYHAIIIAQPDTKITRFPDDSKGMSISFADVGSTSGWLIPTFYAKEVWKIDPKAYWKYTEGATHAANEVAVAEKQVDLATDFDRNRNAMLEGGKIKPDGTKIVWTSDDLPNDAIALPKTASAEMVAKVKQIVLSITTEQAQTLMPKHYTGFVAATHDSYKQIEDAGIAVGKITRK